MQDLNLKKSYVSVMVKKFSLTRVFFMKVLNAKDII
jgi:hypothetical protein